MIPLSDLTLILTLSLLPELLVLLTMISVSTPDHLKSLSARLRF